MTGDRRAAAYWPERVAARTCNLLPRPRATPSLGRMPPLHEESRWTMNRNAHHNGHSLAPGRTRRKYSGPSG